MFEAPMYMCKDCGNTDKFIGIVSEKGSAFIYQNKSGDKKNWITPGYITFLIIAGAVIWKYEGATTVNLREL